MEAFSMPLNNHICITALISKYRNHKHAIAVVELNALDKEHRNGI
jgi:hypothetical protein